MSSIKKLASFLLITNLASLSFAQGSPTPSPLIMESLQRMTAALVICPERVWPQKDWQDYNLLFLDQTATDSWLWRPKEGTLNPIPNKEFGPEIFASLYEFKIINDKKTVLYNTTMKLGNLNVAQTAIHEGFHYKGQENWRNLYPDSSRSTAYPVSGQSRVYRILIFEKLKEYFKSQDEVLLQQAKYWFEKWKALDLRESKNYSDTREGTAEYTGQFATALSELGCQSSDADLIKLTAENISKRTLNGGGRLSGISSESYAIGGLATLIAKSKGLLNLKWTEQLMGGQSPMELLFKDVQSLPQSHPRFLSLNYAQRAKKSSANYDIVLKEPVQNWTMNDYVRVVLPFEWIKGSFTVFDHIYAKQIQKDLMIMGKTDFYKSDSSHIHIANNEVVFLSPIECGTSFILVRKNELTETQTGQYKFKTKKSEGKISGKIISDESGLPILCTEQ